MRHFPIEHGEDAPAAVMQEVAGAVVAVHDGYLLRRPWRIAAQAAHRCAGDRLRVAFIAFDHRLPGVERLTPAIGKIRRSKTLSDRQRIRIAARDPSENGKQLLADRRGMVAVRLGHHHRGDLAAVDAAHDEEGPFEQIAPGLEHQRLGHRHASVKRLVGQEFDLPVRVDQAAGRIAPQDQAARRAACLGIEAIGFAAGATRDAREIAHLHVPAPGLREIPLQLQRKRHAGAGRCHGAKSCADLNPDGACGPATSCSSTPRPRCTRPSSSLQVTSQSAWICR